MTTTAPKIDLDAIIRDSHRAVRAEPKPFLDAAPQPPPEPTALTRARIRKGLAVRAAGVFVWATGLALFVFGVAPHTGGMEWRADPAIALGALLGLVGFGLAELAERYMPAGGLANYVACDPDLSQSWAVGIGLGGGGCGGGDGGGGGGC